MRRLFENARLFFCTLFALLTLYCPGVNAQEKKTDTVLTSDPRLATVLTIPGKRMKVATLSAMVRPATGVQLYTDDGELKNAGFFLGGNKKVSAMMDAAAALWLVRWEKDTQKNYKMLSALHEFNIFKPRNEFETKRFQAGLPFIAGFDQLPDTMRAALARDQAIPITALPPAMQESVRKMADAMNQQDQQHGDFDSFPLSRLNESRFKLNIGHPGKFSQFFLTLSIQDWGSMGFSFNDYEKSLAPQSSNSSEEARNAYIPVKEEISRKEAKRQPTMKRKVTLQTTKITLSQAVRLLHEQYGYSVITDLPFPNSMRASVDIRDVPLGDALDKLVQLFPGSEWEYRASGFIVVRDALNPACHVKPQTTAELH